MRSETATIKDTSHPYGRLAPEWRYSYVANNPLKYTDPSGNDWGDYDEWDDDYGHDDGDPRSNEGCGVDPDGGVYGDRPTMDYNQSGDDWWLANRDNFEQERYDYEDVFADNDIEREYKNGDDIGRINNSFDVTRGIGPDSPMTASMGDGREKGNNISVENAKEVNNALDNGLTVTEGLVVGAQKLADSKVVLYLDKVPMLGKLSSATGIVSLIIDGNKFIDNPKKNWFSGVKVIGNIALWYSGVKEAQLLWNLSTLGVDGIIYVIKK